MNKKERIEKWGEEKYKVMQRMNRENMRAVRGYYTRKGRILDPNRAEDERFINEEMKVHMGNLYVLSDGRIGKEYTPDIKVNLMSGKIEGPK